MSILPFNERRTTLFRWLVLLFFLSASFVQAEQVLKHSNAAIIVPLFQQSAASDLGMVSNAQVLSLQFSLSNPKASPVRIISIEASCGCTVIEGYESHVDAQGMTSVEVDVDLTGKRGTITKLIDIRYQHEEHVYDMPYELQFNVMSDTANHQEGFLGKKLFGEDCGDCHAAPAKGKEGEELFEAVCASCHGSGASGAYAMGFTTKAYLEYLNAEYIRQVIAQGTPDGYMPGFEKEHGGPLTTEQVESLVDYMKSLRVRWKKFLKLSCRSQHST